MKVVKGNKSYPIITGEDVIIAKGKNLGLNVDDVLDNQQNEIDKLKSNMKYIYSYGGVGGNGSGGSGGSSSGKEPSLYISLAGRQLQSGGNTIILGEPGVYEVEGNIRNSNGETFYLKVAAGTDIEYAEVNKLSTELNQCKYKNSFNLKNNGVIIVNLYNSDFDQILQITQNYIVKPHTFDMKFMYKFDGGRQEGIFPESNEYFIGDLSKSNPFIDATFKIDIPGATNISINYSIGDTDVNEDETKSGQGIKTFTSTDISNNHFRIYLDNLTRNESKFTSEKNTGVYDVSLSLIYYVNGDKVETVLKTKITLIPNYLYINVRSSQDVLYDTLEDIVDAISQGKNGIPERHIYAGSYVSFYCKIYEGNITTNKHKYDLIFNAFDGHSLDSNVYDFEFDDDPTIEDGQDGVTEQVEMSKPISVPFGTLGVKKLVFKTYSSKLGDGTDNRETVKYIFVRESSSTVDWHPVLDMSDYYFKANQGEDTYSTIGFSSTLPSGVQPFEMSVSDNPYELKEEEWKTIPTGTPTTILSMGMQYSMVNADHAKIFEVFAPLGGDSYSKNADITLYSDQLFSETSDQKRIRIPYENNFDKTNNKQYHLVQIVRHRVGYDKNNNPQYASYLYIDGILESNKPSIDTNAWFIGKILFNNVNVVYNLINIQYISNKGDINLDGLIYQYYLKYKEKMKGETLSDAEKVIYNNIDNIKFDGSSVILTSSVVQSIAPNMPIPTMMFSYNPGDTQKDIEDFETALFQGYANGDTGAFGKRDIQLWWCNAVKENNKSKFHEVKVPEIGNISGSWYAELQGTSTMRNKLKNFSLGLDTTYGYSESDDKLLFSPNFDSKNPHSFLPEQIWTIKADIADSAHANNTSIGKFVNKVCKIFNTGQNLDANLAQYVKNTLEGFPVMMYFQIKEKVYYLGVYNFNMGRNSYYNLGYNTAEDMTNMFESIRPSLDDDSFSFAVGKGHVVDTLAIGEIQDNFAQFDFHQFDESVLFQPDSSSATRMFGRNRNITGVGDEKSVAKGTLKNFVKSVATAGAYCFANINKNPVSSESRGDCVDRYNVVNQVPDLKYQFKYEGDKKIWYEQNDITFETVKGDVDYLLKCIYPTLKDGETINDNQTLDYTSASEYYTICMAFGLVDSVLKNMNIKSWDGKKCYIAFYDMDCANGENNAGGEDVSYLAATDYWHSNFDKGYVEPVEIDWDYWTDTVGKGFDFKSSYLFAIVKYAQPLLNSLKDVNISLTHYPQEFWAELRNPETGELRNVDHFINNYFISGIGQIPSYMASLNYQVKYLYKGTVMNDNGTISEEKYLANSVAFNGSRLFKVKDWLTRRFHFLDAMFNVQGINIPISAGVTVPIPNNLDKLNSNPDIVILSDVFSNDTNTRILTGNNALTVNVYAPMNTPFVITRGSYYEMYLLCAGVGKPNPIQITTVRDVATRFLGSKEFTNLSMVEPFFTDSYQIISDKLEEVVYGKNVMPEKDAPLSIVSSSVKKVILDIPQFSGTLVINNQNLNGQAIHTLDVSNSGFYGDWSNLKNLQNLNISSVHDSGKAITISGCPLLRGNSCSISGKSQDELTSLSRLTMTGVSGDFNLTNTDIEIIEMTSVAGMESTFSIDGDRSLKTLELQGFQSVHISNCPNITTLKITDVPDGKCREIIIDVPDTYADYEKPGYSPKMRSFNSSKEGMFDFSSYTELEVLGVSGCYGAEIIRIPNRKVSVVTFRNNLNLEFVDTPEKNSIIELMKDSTFYMCPRYCMRQSWWGYGLNGQNISESGNIVKEGVVTKMIISPECTSLAHTFDRVYGQDSKYISEPYVNEWGQKVKNKAISMGEAKWFIEAVVGGGELDDAYINLLTGDIVDNPSVSKRYGTDCRMNIESLQGCFRNQKGIRNTALSTNTPSLSKYTSLTDVSGMYYGTDVQYISSALLSFPKELNTNDEPIIKWHEFVRTGEVTIDINALENISYRINDLSSLVFTVKDKGETCDNIDIVDIFHPVQDENGDNIPIERLRSLSMFSINFSQSVDYTKLFELCPNVTSLTGFLSGDLSKAKIDGILKPCKNLMSVTDSFVHSGTTSIENLPEVDLYEFFDWENNIDIYSLFASSGRGIGFAINKVISFENFKKVLKVLSSYKNITSLSNIFSYCTITDYNSSFEITLDEDMPKVKLADAMFYKCKSNNGNPLNIKRSLFEHLPNVVSLSNAFGGVEFADMLSFDFFNKRKKVVKSVYVKENDEYVNAELHTYEYNNSLITNLSNSFKNAKFRDCNSWFDINYGDNQNLKPETDKVIKDGVEYDTYYTYEGGKYNEHIIKEPIECSDCRNNFTNYVPNIIIPKTNKKIDNHDINLDIQNFGNNKVGSIWGKEFNRIISTHCCLPPDIFFGCNNDCDLSNVFANTNIVGVIPQHLVTKCYNGKFNDMLLNTNILPNIFYHYDKKNANDSEYLDLIKDIPVDNTTITIYKNIDDDFDYTLDETNASVLFRDSEGTLKRRYPRNGNDRVEADMKNAEYSKSQYTYIPQGFTSNANLQSAFTFRYNLPENVDLYSSVLANDGIVWAEGNYTNDYSPEVKPFMWPYYTQYFMMADESLNWRGVRNISYPFIDSGDVDFMSNKPRLFSSNEEGNDINKWWSEREFLGKDNWHSFTNGLLNSFLNLCGERDIRTGELKDCGLMISKSMNNMPKLDRIISGNLSTLLNGKVFDDSLNVGVLTNANINDSKVLHMFNFARNIILPIISQLPNESTDKKVIIDFDQSTSQFYEFMFQGISLGFYRERYFKKTQVVFNGTDNPEVKYKVL